MNMNQSKFKVIHITLFNLIHNSFNEVIGYKIYSIIINKKAPQFPEGL
jgi:hypothetical protein